MKLAKSACLVCSEWSHLYLINHVNKLIDVLSLRIICVHNIQNSIGVHKNLHRNNRVVNFFFNSLHKNELWWAHLCRIYIVLIDIRFPWLAKICTAILNVCELNLYFSNKFYKHRRRETEIETILHYIS